MKRDGQKKKIGWYALMIVFSVAIHGQGWASSQANQPFLVQYRPMQVSVPNCFAVANANVQGPEMKREPVEVNQLKILKMRYKKGLELIRILYEKLLALDHHFSSLQTHQNVMLLSNPNNYPEFQQVKKLLEDKMKKKNILKLPSILETNAFLSASFSLAASLFSEGDAAERQKELEKIACILDFTVRMNNDLSVIYYETEFLKKNNLSLKEDCHLLFADYTRPIAYAKPLDKCRLEDDWERIAESLDAVIGRMEAAQAKSGAAEAETRQYYKDYVNLEFAVDRLLDFINKYSSFVSQGEKYYQKFQVILSNYGNESHCNDKLPKQFAQLKQDVEASIEKFDSAYNLLEIKGSRLKDLLYGAPE